MSDYASQTAEDDFNRVRTREVFQRLFHALRPTSQQLLSLNEVKEVIRPKGETYRGMDAVKIDRIVGSEGRYRDFNKSFLPRHGYLRGRWTSIDRAHLLDVILPPVRLYEIGGVYFVRDGNHRVSVAKAQGVYSIDAEITSLNAEVSIDPSMTQEDLRREVVEYERKEFLKRTNLHQLIPEADIRVTEPGRYEEIEQHILGHKYFMNQNLEREVSFRKALISWYHNVYRPIATLVRSEKLLSRFPKRTEGDLYMWIVKYWHELKQKYGPEYSLQKAAYDYTDRFGRPRFLKRFVSWLALLPHRILKEVRAYLPRRKRP